VCFHPEIQAYFAGGILWAELGPEPDLLSALKRWIALLGEPDAKLASLGEALIGSVRYCSTAGACSSWTMLGLEASAAVLIVQAAARC